MIIKEVRVYTDGGSSMQIQVLVAAMNQKMQDYSLLDKMNIHSDVIVGNQCNYNSIEAFEYNGYRAIYLNFKERGVGLNRNNALMRATGDICLFADDDISIYPKDYFCPLDYETGKLELTPNTRSIHHYTASWQDPETVFFHQIKAKMVLVFGEKYGPYFAKSISIIKYRGFKKFISEFGKWRNTD